MDNKKTVLISGGSGLVGSHLTDLLLAQGYHVSHLSRQARTARRHNLTVYHWDPAAGIIDPEAIKEADYIVHLAGESVASGRWTQAKKKSIKESRVQTTDLLVKNVLEHKPGLKCFISASAIGYYGHRDSEDFATEEDPAGTGFLPETARLWESGTDPLQEAGIRLVTIRIGIVLSDKGGALPKMIQPIKMLAGSPLGTGKQYMSWIHIDDLCKLFIFALENDDITGVYNGVAPSPVTNKEMTEIAANALNRPLFLPAVPTLFLKIMLGDMSEIVLEGAKVSSKKIENAGFSFQYRDLNSALRHLL